MTLEQIKTLENRHIYRKDASERRLHREQIDPSVIIDKEVTARMPKIGVETLGVGYMFDQLTVIDLKEGGIHKLPSRYDITKASGLSDETLGEGRTLNRRNSFYNGALANGRITPSNHGVLTTGVVEKSPAHCSYQSVASKDGLNQEFGAWNDSANDGFMMAFAGNGYASKGQVKGKYEHYTVAPLSEGELIIDFPAILKLSVGDDILTGEQAQGLSYLYSKLSPSAWETIETNQEVIADFSLAVKDLENTLDAIYNRGRSHLGMRLGDSSLMRMVLSLVELGAAIRTKRWSQNITSAVADLDRTLDTFERIQFRGFDLKADGTPEDVKHWTEGVINDFFLLVQDRYLVVPWWLVNSLNFYDFIEDERDRERRDISRKDAVETLHYIFECMDLEKGLLHGSDSTLPMLLFDKFKEGQLKSFNPSEYTSVDSTLAANLLGYRTVRDADKGVYSTTAGNVGYYATLPNAHGMLLGSEKAEFLDRIAEAGEHTMACVNPENFKDGMQLSASFMYTSMFGRVQEGEAHLEYRVYPGGWMRGIQREVPYYSTTQTLNNSTSDAKIDTQLQILFFPLLGWSQYAVGVNTRGFLPTGMNGAAYTERLGKQRVFAENLETDQPLWPNSAAGENYWQPGRDNYSALLLKGTNDLYQTWVDRVDTIATEGVVVPPIGYINLVAEMSYDTPNALVTRNFPHLRKLLQQASLEPVLGKDDVAFDFMSAGDDVFGISNWRGSTPWKLVDRALDNEAVHPRDGGLDLMPHIHVSGTLPESWTDVFQCRDWFMQHTALDSEPIMDSYTRQVSNTTFRNGGYCNSRLVIYVDETELDGRVKDLTGTPIIGSFLLDSEIPAVNKAVYSEGDTIGTPFSLYPETADEARHYEIFLLSVARSRQERVVEGERVSNAVQLSTSLPNDLSEDDFIPGRGHARRWVDEVIARVMPSASALSWAELFSDTSKFTTPGATLGFMNHIDYLENGGQTDDNLGVLSDYRLAGPNYDPNTVLGHGTEFTLSNKGLIHWNQAMGRMITLAQEGLEYKRAAPMFTIFDKDINDITESRLRQSLIIRGLSTVGPLTYVATMLASGEAESSVTITGDERRQLISLTSGAGSSADSGTEPEAEDEAAGDENPSLSIAEKPAVE